MPSLPPEKILLWCVLWHVFTKVVAFPLARKAIHHLSLEFCEKPNDSSKTSDQHNKLSTDNTTLALNRRKKITFLHFCIFFFFFQVVYDWKSVEAKYQNKWREESNEKVSLRLVFFFLNTFVSIAVKGLLDSCFFGFCCR